MKPSARDELAGRIGLNPEVAAARIAALGLTAQDRAALQGVAAEMEAFSGEFIDGLYERFRGVAELAAFLGSEEQVARLKALQRRYVGSLFAAEMDWEYVLSRVEIGAVHQRVRLTPQWFLATYAHFVAEFAPLLLRRGGTAEEGLALVMALLKSVMFDATVVLDAYGMAEEMALRSEQANNATVVGARPVAAGPGGEARREPGGALTRVRVTGVSAGERRGFVGLTAENLATLRAKEQTWQAALPWILDDFYRFFTSHPETAALVGDAVVSRLQQQVRSYWQEFATGDFERLYATSRMRVGLVHERIGLTPQWYLIGLTLQAEGLLRAAAAADPIGLAATVEAFARGLFFDVSYVMDAYMEARADTILRTEGYANQLVAGLTSGVLVIDGDRRVISVNRTLVELLRVDGAMLYRAPVEQVLPMGELGELLEKAGQAQRVSVTGRMGGRLCRVSALALDAWEGIRGRPVAIIVDDVSDLMRLASESEQTDARLAALIQAVDMTVWEMDPAGMTVELISAPVLALTGYRDVYFLGRRDAWVQCISPVDRPRFSAYAATLPAGGSGAVEYRMVRADGREIWVRSSLRRGAAVLFGATVDITAERLTEQRRAERDQALARDRAKSDLLATMSHEIRTPLNGVIGMLDYLLGSPLGAQYVPHVRTAQESALELLSLLNDILDLSKLEAGRMELHPKRFDVVALVEGLEDLFGPQAVGKGLYLRVEWEAALGAGWVGDAHRVRQILVNLLSNAVKFTKAGGVTLTVSGDGEGLVFAVADTGQGVAEEKRGFLFQPFTQAHVSTDGTGLGLSISQRLAGLMGGGVSYMARAGGGSVFVVKLAMERAAEEELPAGEGREVALLVADGRGLVERLERAGWRVVPGPTLDACLWFIDDVELIPEVPDDVPLVVCGATRPGLGRQLRNGATYVLGLAPLNEKTLIEILSSLTPATAGARFGGTVLVAEDNPVSQRVVTLMLERLGFDVDVVVNGSFAVDAAKRKAYSLVLMDMLMPEMGGLEACRLIRRESKNQGTPIIALTANAFDRDREECLSAGMDAVLTKPLQIAALQQVVTRWAGVR